MLLKINKSDTEKLDISKMTFTNCYFCYLVTLSSSVNFFLGKVPRKLCPLVVTGKNNMFSSGRIKSNNVNGI